MNASTPYQTRTPPLALRVEAAKPPVAPTGVPLAAATALHARITAYRRPGGAVVTVSRGDGRKHRHVVSLRRYRLLWDALFTRALGTTSGWFGARGLDVYLWR